MSIAHYAEKIEDLFVNLTISQANSDEKACEILRPINEQLAIQKLADGLRNRQLSNIIAARDYSNFKDAVRAATFEVIEQPSGSNTIFNMRNTGASLSAISTKVLSERIPINRVAIVINGIGGKIFSEVFV
ncbi:Uncharacterized protein OBRU01_03944 [Operophtera brumata]|uniref:Uncharacterized protein n=1 Tax=Operophtera brumata TaxID=104452 RepID=A0A0L7LGU3_OPEBR|nr:Uncharacterized protein OBRU01_03944 [Operophtera brumata]